MIKSLLHQFSRNRLNADFFNEIRPIPAVRVTTTDGLKSTLSGLSYRNCAPANPLTFRITISGAKFFQTVWKHCFSAAMKW